MNNDQTFILHDPLFYHVNRNITTTDYNSVML